jgi:hypothetical protein
MISAMFGPRLRSVFKSCWHALLWASCVLLTAYCSVPAPDQQGTAEKVAAIVAASKQGGEPVQHHANPWARDNR